MTSQPSKAGRPFSRFRVSLTQKLTLWLTIGMCIVLVAHFYTTVQRERLLFERTKEQYGTLLANAIASRLAGTLEPGSEQKTITMDQEYGDLGEQLSILWTPLDVETAAIARLNPGQRDALANGSTVTFIQKVGKRDYFYTFAPVPAPVKGAVVVVDSFNDSEFYIQASTRRFLIGLSIIIAINALLAWVLGSWLVARPFARLTMKARQVGSGNLTLPVNYYHRDEIGDLAHEMDRMSENILEAKTRLESEEMARQRVEEELRHAERLATIGKLAAGVAHELGTPLNVISGRAARLARHHEHDPDIMQETSIIRSQVDQVTRIVRQLLHFARRRKAKKSMTDLVALIRSVVADVEPTLEPGVRIEYELDGVRSARLQLDEGQIRQVLTNLMVNAAQAMPGGGPLNVTLSRRRTRTPLGSDEGDYYRVAVKDHGGGIATDDLPHIFEPFFTTKEIGKGTGLGLAVSHGIVTEHNGWIDVKSETGTGSCFTVFLPAEEG